MYSAVKKTKGRRGLIASFFILEITGDNSENLVLTIKSLRKGESDYYDKKNQNHPVCIFVRFDGNLHLSFFRVIKFNKINNYERTNQYLGHQRI